MNTGRSKPADAMRTTYHSIAAILGSVILLIPGNALLNTLTPLRGKLEGFPSVTLGLLGSVYFGAMLLGSLVSPAIVKRIGYVPAYGMFAWIAAAASATMAYHPDPAWWLALRGTVGFCVAGLFAITDGWVQGKADNANRGRLGAVYQFTHFAASSVGQALVAAADPRTATLFLLVAGLLAAAVTPLALARTPPPARPATVKPEVFTLLRTAPVAAVGTLTAGAANGSFWSLAPVFALLGGLSTTQISAFLTATVVGSAVAIWPLGRLSDRMDRRVILTGQMGTAVIFEITLAWVGARLGWGTAFFGFLIGCTSMTIYSIAMSHANDRADPARSVGIASSLLFFYCAGAMAGPPIAVEIMEHFGPTALFLCMATVHGVAMIYTLARIFIRPPAKIQPQPDRALMP